jgi:hypothetical protein
MINQTFTLRASVAALTLLCAAQITARAGETNIDGIAGFQDTPMLPGTPWHVHDPSRPQPPIVTPGDQPGKAPSDAIVLFDGTSSDQWVDANGNACPWPLEDGCLLSSKGGDIHTKQEFGDVQVHVEFKEPLPVKGDGQGRGNSGVFLMGKFEVQVLDCYDNKTYPDGQTSALYGQHPPLANACRPPGEWQTYDIAFTTPRVNADGSIKEPAYATVFHNGVLVQNHEAYLGPTGWRFLAHYDDHTPVTGPVALQYHNNPVRFRNIWIRPIVPVK